MRRRTRRRLTGAATVLAAGAIYTWTHNEWAAAITGLIVAALGLLRPPRRRGRARRRRMPTVARPPQPIDHLPHVLYRPADTHQQLLYAGIVVDTPDRNIEDRVREHADSKPWWHQAVWLHLDYHRDRLTVLANEAWAIHTEDPLHNRTHRTHGLAACTTIARAHAAGITVPSPPLHSMLLRYHPADHTWRPHTQSTEVNLR